MSNLPQDVLDLRLRGYAGGAIPEHRAFRRVPDRTRISWSTIVLVVVMTTLTMAALPAIASMWTVMLARLAPVLGLGEVIASPRWIVPFIQVEVPHVTANAPLPSRPVWWLTLLGSIVLLVVSFFLPKRVLPIAYLIRALLFVQVVSLTYFALFAAHFPYTLAGYTSDMHTIGLAIIALVPIVYGVTYFVFDFGVVRKVWIVLASLGHLIIFIPLQYLVHGAVVAKFSLLFLPVLFMIFGALLDVSILIALYGWAMSWKDRDERRVGRPGDPERRAVAR
ncbi:MAG: hypothetical protein WEE89_17595 [Gemmatimonadota bacterium]